MKTNELIELETSGYLRGLNDALEEIGTLIDGALCNTPGPNSTHREARCLGLREAKVAVEHLIETNGTDDN